MTRPEKRILSVTVALVTALWVGPAGAVNIKGSKLQAKPSIKFQFQSKDAGISPAGLNPVADGATLTVVIGATTLTFNMPSANWTGTSATGFKYKNATAPAGGVVKVGQIKAGKMKVLTKGSSGDVGGAFPLPAGADANVTMSVSGTQYCAKFLESDASDSATGYLNKNTSLTVGSCVCADCCGSFTKIKTLTSLPDTTVNVGSVKDDSGATLLDLKKGGLYFGGAGNSVPMPSLIPNTLPDANGFAGTYTKITACAAGSFTISPTGTADVAGSVHPERHCSSAGVANGYSGKPGCLFGPPLAIPNGTSSATSTCVVNRISVNASGSAACDGTTSLSLPLLSDIYLTGPTDGLVPCPVCTGAGPTCSAGPNAGQPCVPESSAIPGQSPAANPTSHDCPPASAAFIGSLPIGFALSTGTQTKTALTLTSPGTGQNFMFYGFCGQQFSPSFENPAHACTANSDCTVAPNTKCRQRDDGAFVAAAGPARTITATGTAPGCLTDGAPHALNLISIFGIPPSFNATVDASADLPGPGFSSLPGTTQLVP